MLFHGISGGHIQGIMEEMERRSKTEARLAKGAALGGRDAVRRARPAGRKAGVGRLPRAAGGLPPARLRGEQRPPSDLNRLRS